MNAGSGLLLPTLDELIAEAGHRSGVSAVLDAADKLHRRIEDLESRLPWPPSYYAQCVCGSVMEVYGDVTDEDRDAIRDWDDLHAYCQQDDL
ncbi:hypothetical protein [Mycobacterium avium]|uniref:hypothetical protein n=1 Tax=Mycobacterium avium TaxID=1764 RepID=UPI000CE3061E|nr:hypothetical protein [Mycobacterium avium]